MHPFKSQAESSNKSKRSSINAPAKTLPYLAMNGAYKDVKSSTGNLQQHKDQNAAPGMKRGGRLDKGKRGKSKIVRDLVQATPPSPEDMITAQAGAGGLSPPSAPASPMPPPQMPMRKSGGAVKKADGGSVKLGKYPIDAGAMTGVARVELQKKSK
jgi:hypothetical protein